MTLKQIKSKRASVQKTRKVTKSMEAVSAVKMRKSQERALGGRPFAIAALTVFKRVVGALEQVQHPYTEKRDVKNVGYVVVTSDRGLAGALTSSVFKKIQKHIAEKEYKKDQIKVVAIGKKGLDYFTKRDYTVLNSYTNISDSISSDEVHEMSALLAEYFLREEFDVCYLVYSSFKSTFEQEAQVRRLLPLSFGAVKDMVDGITPEKGKYSETNEEEVQVLEYEVEPSPEEVFKTLVPLLLNIEVYHGILEAKASEHSARMVAMKNASDKAGEVIKELTLAFNKTRQALITREVSEIVAGVESTK